MRDLQPPFSPSGQWTFQNPVRLRFGRAIRHALVDELAGKQGLIVSSARGRAQITNDPILSRFANAPGMVWVDTVRSNPGVVELQTEISRLSAHSFEAVIAIGGGSVIDSAKVLAVALSEGLRGTPLKAMLTNPGLLGHTRPLQLYAVPTTSGTGSEVTPFATVWDRDQKKKYSLSGQAVFPYAAIVDPALTDNLPDAVTLSTGLDAINQAAESIWNKNATPVTIGFATRALQLGLHALPKLANGQGGEVERDQMSECSLLAGLAISMTRTALCHSISYPLTAHFGVPHGLACAFTMPAVLRHSLTVDDGRFVRLASDLIGEDAKKTDLVTVFDSLNLTLGVRERVASLIPSFDALVGVISEMFTQNRIGNYLGDVNFGAIKEIVSQSWGPR